MILVNFKIYKESFGERSLELAKICKSVGQKKKIKIFPVVSALEVFKIKSSLDMPVFIQNCDPFLEGAKTGFISPIQAQECGAIGSIINHSEHQIKPGTVKSMLNNWPKGFESVVCIQTIGQADRWARNIKPSYIAYEPSHLIGNRDKSVSSEEPEAIKKLADKFKNIPLLVGAGISSVKDVETALSLGAKGVLISSAIVKAADPEAELLEIASAF